jgi:hypothetical protein
LGTGRHRRFAGATARLNGVGVWLARTPTPKRPKTTFCNLKREGRPILAMPKTRAEAPAMGKASVGK